MRVAVLVIEGAFDSGLTTVSDVLAAANVLRGEVEHPPPPWEVTRVGTRRYLHTAAGLRVTTVAPASLESPPDVLVVPAFGLRTLDELIASTASAPLRSTIGLIRRWHASGTELAAACSGTLLLAESGALDGCAATTSWWLGARFRERYPAVRLAHRRHARHGPGVTTAGAAFAHIDLALSLVHRRSPALADLVARYLLIGDRASQASFAAPSVMARHSPEMAAFEQWVRAHLDVPIRIADAAPRSGSPSAPCSASRPRRPGCHRCSSSVRSASTKPRT